MTHSQIVDLGGGAITTRQWIARHQRARTAQALADAAFFRLAGARSLARHTIAEARRWREKGTS